MPFESSIPNGVKAYTLDFSGSQINGTLITNNTIPANTPVLVSGSGSFTFSGAGNIVPLLNPRTGIATSVYIRVKVPITSYYLTMANGAPTFTRATASIQPSVNSFDAYLSPATTASSLQVVLNDAAFPVSLGSFTATQVQKEVRLDWNTYTEVNNRGFDVERSADGTRFDKIGFVTGKGNSNSENRYAFTDHSPITGVNHYRLRQVDADGNSRYYPVRTMRFNTTGPVVSVYPNPVKNILFIDGNGQKVSGTLLILDGGGRVVLQTNINPSNKATVDISKLPAGIYVYKLDNLKGTFIKQ